MITMLASRWWVLAIRGAAAIAFGLLTFRAPASGLLALVIVFGAYALVDGVTYLSLAYRGTRQDPRWGWLIFSGVVGIAAGLLALIWPGISAYALLMVIAGWSVVTGIAGIVAAARLRREVQGEWLLGAAGLLSAAFGVLVFMFPRAGALALVLWIAAYAIVHGAMLLALAFRLRAIAHAGERAPHAAAPTPA